MTALAKHHHRVDAFVRTPAEYRPKAPQTFNWTRVRPDSMAVHKIGRTCPEIQPYTHEQAEAVALEVGYQFDQGWTSLSPGQQIDFVATWLIAQYEDRSRQMGRPVLSAWQYYHRSRREIPMDTAAMDALLRLRPDRAQLYRGGGTSEVISNERWGRRTRDEVGPRSIGVWD